MDLNDVLPRLRERDGMFLCSVCGGKSGGSLKRVPIEHRRFEVENARSAAILAELPSVPSCDQLRVVLANHSIGLFAPVRVRPDESEPGSMDHQSSLGSIILLPPTDWAAAKDQFAQWQFSGVDKAFAGLPYTFDDILVFSRLNYSPDCWFTVLRGPAAGKVFWWTHDGDSEMIDSWADDLRDWARRIWAEVPDVFGGEIRFSAAHSIDSVPEDAQLYPERYVIEPQKPDGN